MYYTETKDSRKFNKEEGMTDEMKRINRSFSHHHAMTIHLNLMSMIATVWYGFSLASRIKIA